MAYSRNAEKGVLYVNRWYTGEISERSPLFVPLSAMGIQLINRQDTLWDGLNVEISPRQTLVRSFGFSKYCSTAFASSDYPLTWFSFKNTSGTIRAMADCPTKVVWFDTTTINTVFSKTGTAQGCFTKVLNTVYYCDGNDADTKKWDGTTVSKWGISAPVVAPTLSFGAGALSPKSGYTYVYVFKNSSTGHISTASPVSAATGALTSQNITVGYTASTDTQVDKIDIYRTTDGGGLYYYLATVNNATSTYTDSTPDTGLNTFLVAPLAHLNDPPPSGIRLSCFHMGRQWVATDGFLNFGGGPDITNGVPEECFPPGNVFKLPGTITALGSTSQGLLVFTQDQAYLVTGQTTASFAINLWQDNLGIPNANCLVQDGDTLFFFTSKSQLWRLSPNGLDEIGARIRTKLGAYNSTNVYLALHRSGADEGLFISNGSTDVRRYSLAMDCWCPLRQPVGGVKSLASLEVTTGNWLLMLGRTSGSGYIYYRNTSSYSDDGSFYVASATIGPLIAASPGQPPAELSALLIQAPAVGTYPTVSVLLNEVSGTYSTLPNPVPEPPELATSVSIRSKRHYLSAMQSAISNKVLFGLVKITFPAEAQANEIYAMGLY